MAAVVVPYFITGTGTDVGKTVSAAILAKALGAWYWKPVQAGVEPATDRQTIASLTGIRPEKLLPETYTYVTPASPHLAARNEGITPDLQKIRNDFDRHLQYIAENGAGTEYLLVEGAGGLMVPLSDRHFVADLVRLLDIPAILVSRHYLGSINHSLLTAECCRTRGIAVKGWVFNGNYGRYAHEIAAWSGAPELASFGELEEVSPASVAHIAGQWAPALKKLL